MSWLVNAISDEIVTQNSYSTFALWEFCPPKNNNVVSATEKCYN